MCLYCRKAVSWSNWKTGRGVKENCKAFIKPVEPSKPFEASGMILFSSASVTLRELPPLCFRLYTISFLKKDVDNVFWTCLLLWNVKNGPEVVFVCENLSFFNIRQTCHAGHFWAWKNCFASLSRFSITLLILKIQPGKVWRAQEQYFLRFLVSDRCVTMVFAGCYSREGQYLENCLTVCYSVFIVLLRPARARCTAMHVKFT